MIDETQCDGSGTRVAMDHLRFVLFRARNRLTMKPGSYERYVGIKPAVLDTIEAGTASEDVVAEYVMAVIEIVPLRSGARRVLTSWLMQTLGE